MNNIFKKIKPINKYISWFVFLCIILIAGCAKPIFQEKQSRLDKALMYSIEKSGNALLIWRDGELILEDYHNGYDSSKPHMLAEISTLLSGLAVIAAKEDGLLSFDEPVSNTIIEWKNKPGKSKVTIIDLLTSTSGLEAGSYKSVPTFQEAIEAPLVYTSGTQFLYGPIPFQVFGALMEKKVGGDYLRQRILAPLGIPGERWSVVSGTAKDLVSKQPKLVARYFDGAHLTAEELGRIGNFILQNGCWKGETILNDLSSLTQSASIRPGFGVTLWLNAKIDESNDEVSFFNNVPEDVIFLWGDEKLIYDDGPSDLYMAAGRYNQRLFIIPSKEMVIVRFGGENWTWSDTDFLTRLLKG